MSDTLLGLGSRELDPTPPARRRARITWWSRYGTRALVLLAGWSVAFCVRLFMAVPVGLPTENPDEIGYLDATRLLSGAGSRFDLSFNALYRGGYPLLLVPAHWLTGGSPTALYRAAQVENAAIGAALLPLAWLLARYCGLSPRRCLLVGGATALLPVPVLLGTHVLTDAVLPTLILAWLLATHRWLTTVAGPLRRAGWGATAGALAALIATSHSRGELVLAAHGVVVLLAAVRRWRNLLDCAATAGVAIGCAAVGSLINDEIRRRIYPWAVTDLAGDLTNRVSDLAGLGWTARVATGEFWYQTAATGGVFAVGVIALVAHVRRRDAAGPTRALALVFLALTAAIGIGSSAALPDDHRVGDTVAMGRYLGGTVTPALFAVGLIALLRCKPRRVRQLGLGAATMLATACMAIEVFGQDRLRHDFFSRSDFPEFAAFNGDGHPHLIRVTVVSAALLGLIVATAASRRSLVPLAGTLAVATLATLVCARQEILRPTSTALARIAATPSNAALDRPVRVAIDLDMPWWIRLPLTYEHQWRSVVLFYGSQEPVPGNVDLVFRPWDGQRPASTTWSGRGAVPGRTIVAQRSTVLAPGVARTGWVAWKP